MRFLLLFVLASSTFAFEFDCARDSRNTVYSSLDWFKATDYHVVAPTIQLKGILCVGFEGKALKRIHYFDDKSNVVLKGIKELKTRDVIFFSRSILPAFARAIIRKADPLSLKVVETGIPGKYDIQVKFVENMMRGFNATRIRLMPVVLDYRSAKPVVQIKGNSFDKFRIKVAGSLKIRALTFMEDNKTAYNARATEFVLTKRK